MQMDFITDQTACFIEDVQKVVTVEELMKLLQRVLPMLGVHHFTLGELRPEAGETFAGTFPEEWTDRYVENQYVFRDPVHLKLFRDRQGFCWDEKRLAADQLLNRKSEIVFREGCDFGLHQGFTHILPSLGGNIAIASFAGERVEQDPKTLPAMHLIALYMHAKFKELTAPQEFPDTDLLSLTPRERECLAWAGQGKTDWEIAQILAIKETTVHSHIENAKRRLKVGTRIQAVVRSARFGLIQC